MFIAQMLFETYNDLEEDLLTRSHDEYCVIGRFGFDKIELVFFCLESELVALKP